MEPIIQTALTERHIVMTLKQKIDKLLDHPTVSLADFHSLTAPEKQCFVETCNYRLKHLKDVERDQFLIKIDPVFPGSLQTKTWEHNHSEISRVIVNHINDSGHMPTAATIAAETGLSRQTISKHLKEYRQHPDFVEHMEQFAFMSPKVLSKVVKFAVKGDMRAARLFFEMTGANNKRQPGTVVNEQTNYIQINNTILSQENLKRLSAAQLDMIEQIVRSDANGKPAATH